MIRSLEAWRTAEKQLSGRAEMAMLPALADLKAQLERLVHRGFVGEAGPVQLRRYPDLPRGPRPSGAPASTRAAARSTATGR